MQPFISKIPKINCIIPLTKHIRKSAQRKKTMSRRIKGVLVSRLVIIMAIILVPIATFLIFNLVDFTLWFSTDPVVNFWILQILCPLVFSLSWVFFLIIFANHTAQSLDTMDKRIGVVSIRYKMFFGINALFIMIIFIFPLITPFVSILSFASIAWRITTVRKDWVADESVPAGTKITMILAALIPLFCTVCIIVDYLKLAFFVFFEVWVPLLDIIFTVSYCLVTAISFGSLIIMIKNRGITDYEQLGVDEEKERTFQAVKLLQIPLFVFFLFLAFGGFEVINFFYQVGFVIMIITSFVNFIQGRREDVSFKSHFFGYLISIVFMGTNFIFQASELSAFIRVWSLVISAGLFIFVFFYTFITLNSDYL